MRSITVKSKTSQPSTSSQVNKLIEDVHDLQTSEGIFTCNMLSSNARLSVLESEVKLLKIGLTVAFACVAVIGIVLLTHII